MLNKNTKITVKNRNNGSIGYTIPDMHNLYRKFYANEKKEVSYEELQKLSYLPGGMYILQNYLVILDNDEARDAILGQVELEYSYTEDDVKNLLLNGSLDELLDCLDFAPAGVIELVKTLAVELEINDLSKRNAIANKTGFNINNAIEIKHISAEEDDNAAPASGRRVAAPAEKTSAPVRRYNVNKN